MASVKPFSPSVLLTRYIFNVRSPVANLVAKPSVSEVSPSNRRGRAPLGPVPEQCQRNRAPPSAAERQAHPSAAAKRQAPHRQAPSAAKRQAPPSAKRRRTPSAAERQSRRAPPSAAEYRRVPPSTAEHRRAQASTWSGVKRLRAAPSASAVESGRGPRTWSAEHRNAQLSVCNGHDCGP